MLLALDVMLLLLLFIRPLVEAEVGAPILALEETAEKYNEKYNEVSKSVLI